MYTLNDLHCINEAIKPLKALADREQKSIYGLTGMVYTPHIDAFNTMSVEKAKILSYLKTNNIIPLSDVETISAELMVRYRRAKNNQVVEHNGDQYECKFAPLKLSKSQKIVRKWGKYWLKHLPNGYIDKDWETQVREVWPENFIIRKADYE